MSRGSLLRGGSTIRMSYRSHSLDQIFTNCFLASRCINNLLECRDLKDKSFENVTLWQGRNNKSFTRGDICRNKRPDNVMSACFPSNNLWLKVSFLGTTLIISKSCTMYFFWARRIPLINEGDPIGSFTAKDLACFTIWSKMNSLKSKDKHVTFYLIEETGKSKSDNGSMRR